MRWFVGFGLLLALGLWGWNEHRLSKVSKADPQRLTCEALGRDGPATTPTSSSPTICS